MRYIGDDLINLMTITIKPKEEGGELPEIESVDLKIGCLVKHYKQPENPFTINLFRDESIRLSTINKVYAGIMYWEEVEGQRKLLKQTCEGELTLALKPEVINGGCKC